MAAADVDMDKKPEGEAKAEKDVEMAAPELTPAEKLERDLLADLKLIAEAVADHEFRLFDKLNRRLILLRKQIGDEGGVLARFVELSANKAGMAPLLPSPAGTCDLPTVGIEGEVFIELLAIIYLIDKRQLDQAIACSNHCLTRIQVEHKASLRFLALKCYNYASRAYELRGRLAEIRPVILAAYRSACLHHDDLGQAGLLTLLLRNYLENHLYDQALKLVSKTSFPETRANAQYARYLFYMGRMKAVQLEYSDAHQFVTQALRKGPKQGSSVGRGFRATATKLSVVVELLMGEIPTRATFMPPELRETLAPYMEITRAVRLGDLNAFRETLQKNEETFRSDNNLSLIQRLRHNVLKTGLRSINVSYSRIPLAKVAQKLGLEGGAEGCEAIVAKAIVDGVIDAKMNHEGQYLQSNVIGDIYSSSEPHKALHKRISFLLQLHSDTVKAMRYPEKKGEEEDAEERRERDRALLAAADSEALDDEDDQFM